MTKIVPESLIEHPYPQQIKSGGEVLIGRHEVCKEREYDGSLGMELEDAESFYIFERGVDGHVQVM